MSAPRRCLDIYPHAPHEWRSGLRWRLCPGVDEPEQFFHEPGAYRVEFVSHGRVVDTFHIRDNPQVVNSLVAHGLDQVFVVLVAHGGDVTRITP